MTICCDTIRQAILVVAIYDTIGLATVIAIQDTIGLAILIAIQDTNGLAIVMVIQDTIGLATVMTIQAAIFLKAVMIDISCEVTVRVSCQVGATARFAVVSTNPEAWMMQLAKLFPLPTWNALYKDTTVR